MPQLTFGKASSTTSPQHLARPTSGHPKHRKLLVRAMALLGALAITHYYWKAETRTARSLADISQFQNMGGIYARREEQKQLELQLQQKKKQEQQKQKALTVPKGSLPSLSSQDKLEKGSTSTSTDNTNNSVCLTNECITDKARLLAKPFPAKSSKSDWCLDEKSSSPNKEGMLLVKVPKAASSTAAGVALRIAHRHHCKALQWQHKPGVTYAKRNPQKSLLFTSIRDPASRVLSYLFFMEVSIQKQEYSEEWILDRLQNFSGRYGSIEDGQGGFSLQFAALKEIEKFSAWSPTNRTAVLNPHQVEANVLRMIEGYDFMLVVDRMDESLVALALLLDIDVGDVLVTSSKVAGSFFHDTPHNQCVELTPSVKSKAVQTYLNSDDWKAQNYGDYLLHAAANQSLDLTIEPLGRERFDSAMERYQMLQEAEKKQCAPKVEFPCSKTGKPQPKLARKQCYQRDFGCGYKCIDEMIHAMDSNSNKAVQ